MLSRTIVKIAAGERDLIGAKALVTMQLSPNQVVVALSLEFADELRTADIEELVINLEDKVCSKDPEVVALFV